MKRLTLIVALTGFISIISYSQIVFENGYFIDELKHKTDCFIRNIDWRNNPTEFEYKLSPDDSVRRATIQTVTEVGIIGASRYIRARVKIDRSGDEMFNLTSDRNPSFQEEQLFLQVLIDGNASLFAYIDGNLSRFFYKLSDSEIVPLVYKRYLIDKNVAQNNFFRQQLSLDLKCPEITLNDFNRIGYNERELKRIFVKYNECTNASFINYDPLQQKDFFNLSFRPGISLKSLTVQSSGSYSWDTHFGNDVRVRFGIEAEFILPFNKNKWGVIIEPTFQNFKSEKTTEADYVSGGVFVTKVNYQSIELPVGIRHYFFINDNSKIFLNVSYIFDFSNNSNIEFNRNDGSPLHSLDIKSRRNMALGIGYKLKDNYSIEIRYQTSREILSDYMFWSSDYRTMSVIFGYSLF